MAQQQRVKTATNTATLSMVLVKNMFRLSLSSICYLRGIFPEDCFSCREYAGIQVHQLECAEKAADGGLIIRHDDAFLLTQWLERGVFDALQQQYLKSLTFAIYASDKEKDDELLETYQFIVDYQKDGAATLNGVAITKENLKKQAVTFIRCLIEFTNTLEDLPKQRYLTMKLAYYPNTPDTYEPEFFSPTSDPLIFTSPPLKIKIGTLQSTHHKLSLQFAGLEHEQPEITELKTKITSLMTDRTSSVPPTSTPAEPVQEKFNKESEKLSITEKYRLATGKAVIKDCVEKFHQKPGVIRKVFYELTDSGVLMTKGRCFEIITPASASEAKRHDTDRKRKIIYSYDSDEALQDSFDKPKLNHDTTQALTTPTAKRPNQNDNKHYILSQEAEGGKFSIIQEPLHQR